MARGNTTMKVYILHRDVDYQFGYIHSVHASLQAAELELQRLLDDKSQPSYLQAKATEYSIEE